MKNELKKIEMKIKNNNMQTGEKISTDDIQRGKYIFDNNSQII